MHRSLIALAFAAALAPAALAQNLTLPPSGDNQKSTVAQNIGPVRVSIDYSSPNVHGPNGEDRRGKIWGTLVPYGLTNLGFGTCKECPWRAGSNQNTVFTVSNDVTIEGQPLPAGRYGLHMIVNPDEWTLVFSKNADSWGSFYYDAKEDALRVKVKPAKSEYNEWLTYEFIDRETDHATAALKWEDVQVPFTIKVDNISDLYLSKVRDELRNYPGFSWENWDAAAQYAIQQKRFTDALEFADAAVNRQFIGNENYQTLTTLALAQEGAGKAAEAKVTHEKAINHPTARATDIHQYARQLLASGKKAEALAAWELNARRYPNQWPVHVGLARGYSAAGRYKEALREAKLALAQAPDELNKKSLADAITKLEAGKDMNL
jgi:tetratricopeptide (TPR) repeat protein